MPAEIPTNSPEKKETLDDNARKFILEGIDPKLLDENNASSFSLIIDWLETDNDNDNETKVAYKEFDNGDVQILLITKTTTDGNRTSIKEKITKEEYEQLVVSSVLHLEKKRYEFTYAQGSVVFSVKYDEFTDGELCMLEVDASSEEERRSFSPGEFPSKLVEVTGDTQYYGYRIAEII
ncbi:MAG: hypothetical protein JWP06_352 [Candidatus Saccharibacteria bacterium]|nr:hypothetical protein [Candidatus Saccharibacteria bacterium]